MTYCVNPDCQQPKNPDGLETCQSCGSKVPFLIRGRYRIVQPLGQGGFGKTFLAVDEDRLGARCVLKQFSPQVKGKKALDKAIHLFEQEARRLHELGEHPHIPTLLAYFEFEQRLYLVQQFVEGATLEQELAFYGPFSDQKIREVLVRLLPILKFVHDRNVIHRDITPANIIRRNLDGRLVLIDFGVAKLKDDTTISDIGTKIGTEGFAPVEQLRNGKAYPASDLYSLGVTCLYLLTQTRPEDLYDPLSGQWYWRDRLAERGAGISDRIGWILDKMVKDLVNDRYQTADEMMHDLRMALSSPAIAAAGARPAVAAGTPTRPASPALLDSHSTANRVTEVLPTSGIRNEINSGIRNEIIRNEINSGISSGIPAVLPPQPRQCLHTLTGHSSWVVAAAISPDSKTIVSGSLDDRIMIWDAHSGDRLGILTGHSKSVNSLTYTPDGEMLISCSDDDTIKIWQMSTGKLLRSLSGHSRDVNAVAVSPDGQFFASGSEDRTVCLWRVATGELLRSYTDISGMVRSVAISPNGQILASGGLDNQIKLWNLVTGSFVRTLVGHQNSVLSIAISADGRYLVSSSKDKTIRIWNPNTGDLIRTLVGHLDIVNAIAISPDGRTLISGSHDKTVKLWNLATGEIRCTLTEHANAVNAVLVSPDNRYFITGSSDNTIKVWKM